MNIVWLAFVMDVETSGMNSIVDRFLNARELPSLYSSIAPVPVNTKGSVPPVLAPQHSAPATYSAPHSTASAVAEPLTAQLSHLSIGDNSQHTGAHIPLHGLNRTAREKADEDTRKATPVTSFFSTSKFTGADDQSVAKLLQDYEICAQQQRLTLSQKASYFINALNGSARDFFVRFYQPHAMSYSISFSL